MESSKKSKTSEKEVEKLTMEILSGNRFALSKAITLCESNNEEKRKKAWDILAAYQERDSVIRIGITGSPGAGKSSFIESFGIYLINLGFKIAILAIDPSSQKSKGSILGDKTRMETLSRHESAYIRPTPSANVLGGLSRSTRESMALCEMAGYDYILIESVGVGQSEVDIGELVDLTILLQMPGGGDEIQGIKRGVIELADIIIINKADGERKQIAELSRKDFVRAMALIDHDLEGWKQKVVTYSSVSAEQASNDKIRHLVDDYISLGKKTGQFYRKRNKQNVKWVEKQFVNKIVERTLMNPEVKALRDKVISDEHTENAFIKLRELLSAVD